MYSVPSGSSPKSRTRIEFGWSIRDAAFASRKTRFLNNVATKAGEAGFYIGDSPHAKAVLRGNRARHNGEYGFFLRDSAHGLAVHNRATHNCIGFGVINTGAPGGARKWKLRNNRALRNNRSCPGGEEGPPLSGLGVGLAGARHTQVRGNVVKGNHPTGPSAFSGGILLISGKPLGGSNAAHDTIARNRVLRNKPHDIIWDGTGQGNQFPLKLAAALLMTVPVAVVYFVFSRRFTQGTYEGIDK